MAITNITKQKIGLNAWSGAITFTAAATAADGVALDFTGKDYKCVVIAQNTGGSSATVTVKAGNGMNGVNDIAAETIAAGETKVIRLDSAAFKNIEGTDRDKVVMIPSATGVKFAVVELP